MSDHNAYTRSPAEIAELFEIASGETDAIRQLSGCVDQLHEVQAAKRALTTLSAAEVRTALEHRRQVNTGGTP
ncbi:MAG: hypothetical protein L0H74_00610 [Brachybacterium sp.]|nr:hypothetical protein [Brachybacterium sp.]